MILGAAINMCNVSGLVCQDIFNSLEHSNLIADGLVGMGLDGPLNDLTLRARITMLITYEGHSLTMH